VAEPVAGAPRAWNGKIQNLGRGDLIGNVDPTRSATDAGCVGSSTDGGHTAAEIGTVRNFGIIQSTHQLDLGMINDYISVSTGRMSRSIETEQRVGG
jgi:hypothetical protein